MKHLVEAYEAMGPGIRVDGHIEVGALDPSKNSGDNRITFTIQDGPIKEVGNNGCQAADMLEYVRRLFESLNNSFPCTENETTIALLKSAENQQTARTADREKRKVEGTNQE